MSDIPNPFTFAMIVGGVVMMIGVLIGVLIGWLLVGVIL